jgi:hypothetical protein
MPKSDLLKPRIVGSYIGSEHLVSGMNMNHFCNQSTCKSYWIVLMKINWGVLKGDKVELVVLMQRTTGETPSV